MLTPYELLEVAEDATDEAIKKAYLRKVREYPPERDAEGFRRVRAAFELIETAKRRLEYRLFNRAEPDGAALLRLAAKPGEPRRPEADLLIGALIEGLADDLIDPAGRR